MEYERFLKLKKEEVFKELQTGVSGLSAIEAQQRLRQARDTGLPVNGVFVGEIFLRQLRSPFVYLLLGAGVLAYFLGERADALMIGFFVMINTLLGFYQEYKSEQTMRLLSQHLAQLVRVRRGGEEETIKREELATGDVVFLTAGDIVPADIRLLETQQFTADESALTGESMVVSKFGAPTTVLGGISQAKNIAFAGTTVSSGEGMGVVVAVGLNSQFGMISKLTTTTRSVGVFEKQIGQFSKFILQLVVITLVVIFLANLLIKGEATNQLEFALFAVALAVSVVPEALPLVATFSFSRGAMKLAKAQVVVKRLSAVEDLGSIEVLCTDKTGTLTENRMTVKAVFGEWTKTLRLAGMVIKGDLMKITNPFDQALIEGLKGKVTRAQPVRGIPFDPLRKRDTDLVEDKGRLILISRGAPETVLDLCALKNRVEIEEWMMAEGQKGRRVWAVAQKVIKHGQAERKLEQLETKMELVGVISFEDPIKSTASKAIKRAQELGVRIVILTGDKREVAEAVAQEIGLVERSEHVMSGEVFQMLSNKQKLEAVRDVQVFARVNPQQKYEIIRLLQADFQVGYLGDGINDAPALKLANVAVAVKGAADIAREAADIVLLKKDLGILIEGISQGREIFANTTKYIKATLAANFGNFYAVAIASLLVPYLPMLPAQILLVNLLSDFPMIAMATDSVDADEVLSPKRFDLKEIVYLATILGIVSSVFDFVTFAVFARFGEAALQTNWFMVSILTELVFIYSIRSKGWFFLAKRPGIAIIGLTGIAGLLTLGLPWMSLGRQLFSFIEPTATSLLIVGVLVVAYFVTTEVVKRTYYAGVRGFGFRGVKA